MVLYKIKYVLYKYTFRNSNCFELFSFQAFLKTKLYSKNFEILKNLQENIKETCYFNCFFFFLQKQSVLKSIKNFQTL